MFLIENESCFRKKLRSILNVSDSECMFFLLKFYNFSVILDLYLHKQTRKVQHNEFSVFPLNNIRV
jgi:hypothetical protein